MAEKCDLSLRKNESGFWTNGWQQIGTASVPSLNRFTMNNY